MDIETIKAEEAMCQSALKWHPLKNDDNEGDISLMVEDYLGQLSGTIDNDEILLLSLALYELGHEQSETCEDSIESSQEVETILAVIDEMGLEPLALKANLTLSKMVVEWRGFLLDYNELGESEKVIVTAYVTLDITRGVPDTQEILDNHMGTYETVSELIGDLAEIEGARIPDWYIPDERYTYEHLSRYYYDIASYKGNLYVFHQF